MFQCKSQTFHTWFLWHSWHPFTCIRGCKPPIYMWTTKATKTYLQETLHILLANDYISLNSPCLLRAYPPCRVKGTWQALWRGLGEKHVPPLSIKAALIDRALRTFLSTHYPCGWALLLTVPTFRVLFGLIHLCYGLHGIFLKPFRCEEQGSK